MTNKNPIIIFTGLAVAAVAGVVGLTRDRWMAPAPTTVVASEATATGEAAATSAGQTTVAETSSASQQPAAEQPAATTAETPAVTTTEQPAAATTTETPAVTTTEQPAAATTTETPAVTTTEQPAAATSAETPAVTTTQQQTATATTAATAVATTEQQPAATAVEQPAATAVEQPAATTTEQPAATTAEQPAAAASTEAPAVTAEQQVASATPETEAAATAQPPAGSSETAAQSAPSFDTVRVEKTGETVVAGRAQAGSEVTLKLNGQTIGTAITNADGAFVVVPDTALPAGSGALTVESKQKNETVAVKSQQTVAVIVPEQAKQNALVAVVSPDQPTKILQKPEPQPAAAPESTAADSKTDKKVQPVTLDAVDYDEAGNIVFSGRGVAGAVARLYVDNALLGDAQAGDDGRWTYAGATPIAPGVHVLRVDGIDAAGAVANRVEVPFFREESRKVASAEAPAADAAISQPGSGTETAAATATPAASEEAKPKEGRVVIQPGNNLWRISNVIYGSGTKYTVLYEANKDLIRNPDLIYPGQVFRTPDVVPPEAIDPARRDPLKPEEVGAGGQ